MSEYKFDDPAEAHAEALRRIIEAEEDGATNLDLSSLGLTSVPPEIGQLIRLIDLDLNQNRLRCGCGCRHESSSSSPFVSPP